MVARNVFGQLLDRDLCLVGVLRVGPMFPEPEEAEGVARLRVPVRPVAPGRGHLAVARGPPIRTISKFRSWLTHHQGQFSLN